MRSAARLLSAAATSSHRPPTKSGLRKPPPPSLEHFIQRQRVLSLWRNILRACYRIPKDSEKRTETIAYAKAEFERNKHVADITQIRYLISTGKTEFESMQRYIDELAAR